MALYLISFLFIIVKILTILYFILIKREMYDLCSTESQYVLMVKIEN
jgi:hypothetical protein